MASPSEQLQVDEEVDAPQLIDYAALRNWLRFSLSAIRRRVRLIAAVCISILLLSGLALLVMPKTYMVECKLLAQTNQVLTVRGDQTDRTNPTRAAAELVMRRDNLKDLIRRTNLIAEWHAARAPVLRLKDWVMGFIRNPPTEAQFLEGMTDYLADRLIVYADESTVTIRIYWRDPKLAYRLVDAARTSFFEARHVREVSTIAESAAILQGRTAEIRSKINAAVREIKDLAAKKLVALSKPDSAAPHRPAVHAVRPHPPAPTAPVATNTDAPNPNASAGEKPSAVRLSDAEVARIERRLSELPVIIQSKERAINEMDGTRLRRLAELQAKLQEQRQMYTSAHPAVVYVEQGIAASSKPSAQVIRLRNELGQLRDEQRQLQERLSSANESAPNSEDSSATATENQATTNRATPSRATTAGFRSRGAVLSAGVRDALRVQQEPALANDPDMEYATARLRFAIRKHEELQEQIETASLDLEVAEAAFKYRYTMVTPPQMPRGPESPKSALVLIAAALGGLFLGIGGAIFFELREGLVREPWQVERLALPVLGMAKLPEAVASDGSERSG